jgi:hypothetical protein
LTYGFDDRRETLNQSSLRRGLSAFSPIDHLGPTFAFLLVQCAVIVHGGPHGSVLWKSRIRLRVFGQFSWKVAEFLEALGEASCHLTPEMFGREVAKRPAAVRVVDIRIKVRYRENVIREPNVLGLPNLEIGVCEKTCDF